MSAKGSILLIVVLVVALFFNLHSSIKNQRATELVLDHAQAWETGDLDLFLSTIHDDIVFAYPGRRLNKEELLEDFDFFQENFSDTKIYIHNIVSRGNIVAVEWQFASTNSDGIRTSVSDAIIGEIRGGKIVSWKEYLDGRVSRMQIAGELPLEEGEEPFPWPLKP